MVNSSWMYYIQCAIIKKKACAFLRFMAAQQYVVYACYYSKVVIQCNLYYVRIAVCVPLRYTTFYQFAIAQLYDCPRKACIVSSDRLIVIVDVKNERESNNKHQYKRDNVHNVVLKECLHTTTVLSGL